MRLARNFAARFGAGAITFARPTQNGAPKGGAAGKRAKMGRSDKSAVAVFEFLARSTWAGFVAAHLAPR